VTSTRTVPTVRSLQAYTARGRGADYHDQSASHWIDDHIASPMARYPDYRASRRSFGLDVLGSVIVVVESSDGHTGFAVTTGGEIAAFIIERHLARFVEGAPVTSLERIWDQMYAATLFYGRKGVVVNAISGVDLALWDLLGQVREEPVHAMIGGAVRDEQPFYATGPRPDIAQSLGFVGGKLPLHHGPAEGIEGLRANLDELEQMRSKVGEDFWLMWDCWMSLDLDYATRLSHAAAEFGLHWIEEALPPDDYWGYAELRRRVPAPMLVTTGEHESTRWGFRLLLDMGCADVIQPDVGWCGGLSELLKISALADAAGALLIPHGSSVYSYHFVMTRPHSPIAEFLMMAPAADVVTPMFAPLLLDEPVPVNGRLSITALDRPGFGVRLNPECALDRPYPH
jgi:L-rhamnonate dehydratase